MASKRVAKSAVDWVRLAERVPANQKNNFAVFKTKSNNYLRSVFANPETPPKIDWAYYKNRVAVAGMVDTFQKSYEVLKVPYPEDKYSGAIDELEKQAASEIAQFKSESAKRISGYEAEITKLQNLIPYDQMTLEEYRDAFPEEALDPINRPTFWPHEAEEQLGYKASDAPLEKKDH